MTSSEVTTTESSTQLRALLESAAEGDERAWAELVGQFHGLLWATARACGLSEADAADVTQTTWLRLAEHLGKITEPAALPGWLVTTTRREAIRVSNRARRPLPAVLLGSLNFDDEHSAVDVLVRAERHHELRVAFRHLGERCRLLLAMLSADARFSYEEISSQVDIPVGSIGPTRRRCLTKLVRILGDRGLSASGERTMG
ncbi:MAG: polymerase sigma factor [Ilumatobacteraceae bacterium]|jgi:RNA polymerase sigma factor (sigma-70 family)|nr:polymerase sigma factor [Ilumatobacteraceae bacterium]